MTGPGLLRRLAARITGRAAVTLTSAAGWNIVSGSSGTDYQATGRNVRVLGWERHPIVNACARVIADQVGTVPFEVYRESVKGEVSVLPDHPARALLDAPRPGLSAHRLRTRTALHFVLYGNAYWVLERRGNAGRPVAIRPVHPERVRYVYVERSTDVVLGYDWVDSHGAMHASAADDVVHFRDLDASEDGIFGFPRAAAALRELSADSEATEYVRQVVKNAGSPVVAVLTESLTKEQAAEAEERWFEKMVQRGERGRTKFLGGVKDIKVLGHTLKDLEFVDLRAISREGLCAAFNVDPRMVSAASAKGAEGGLSGQQYEEARRRLEQQACRPIRTAIESELNLSLTPEYGYVFARFSQDGIADLVEDLTETSERGLKELERGGITREEFRKMTRRPEQMDPAHTLVGPLSRLEYPVRLQFAHTQPQTTQEGSDAPGGRGPAGGGADPAARPDEAETRAHAAVAAAAEGAGRQPGAAPGAVAPPVAARGAVRSRFVRRGVTLSADQRAELWALFDTRATAQEGPYVRAAAVLFDAERADVARIFASVAPAERSVVRRADEDPVIAEAERRILEGYAPGGAYHEAWLARYRALIAETVTVAGGELATTVGVSFTLENPRVQSVIRERAAALVTHVTDTTREQIRAAIAVGREAGMGVREIAKLIDESVYGEPMTRQRATVIARTETVGALNAGEFATAVDSGVMRSKEWMTQGDGRVRDSHQVLDGQRVAIEARFANGLLHPHAPGAPAKEVVQCRCTLLFSDEDPPA